VPCDLAFPTNSGELDEHAAEALALHGCTTIVDAGYAPTTPGALSSLKKLGVTHCPFRATLAIGNALAYTSKEEQIIKADITDEIDREGRRIFEEVQRSAAEYNARGDLGAGAAIASFLRVANVMASHGSV
jgi:glutamate dehydrogenase/leucine dehydrogenase